MKIKVEVVNAKKRDKNFLTACEIAVLQLVAVGKTNKEVAGILSISHKTVEKHRSNIMKAAGTHNASQLTFWALSKGYIALQNTEENVSTLNVLELEVMSATPAP